MNRREKILAICVGLLIVAAGLSYGAKKVAVVFTSRQDRIQELEHEIHGKELMAHRGAVAKRLLAQYRDRSLPSEPEIAELRIPRLAVSMVHQRRRLPPKRHVCQPPDYQASDQTRCGCGP